MVINVLVIGKSVNESRTLMEEFPKTNKRLPKEIV
jgi:hypothetical protein